jgi:hypothetical protein
MPIVATERQAGATSPWTAPTSALGPEPAHLAAASKFTFTLSSLMLVIALIAVGMGLLYEAPGLGILFAIVAIPALARTFVEVGRAKAVGRSLSTADKLSFFGISVALITVICVSALIAFVITCLPTAAASASAAGMAGVLVGLIVGTVAAGFVIVTLSRTLLRRKT